MKTLSSLIILLYVLIFSACDDEVSPLATEENPKDDKSLINVKANYLTGIKARTSNNVDTNADDFLFDTARIVLQVDDRAYNGQNLTSIETIQVKGQTKKLLKLHEAFFNHASNDLKIGYNFRLMYYCHVQLDLPFECVPPFRELKTEDDLKAYLILGDRNKWDCLNNTCCPFVVTTDSGGPICVTDDIEAYWFRNTSNYPQKDYRGGANPQYNFAKLEQLLTKNSIAVCNK